MSKHALISLCCAIALLGAFLIGVKMFERELSQKEQREHTGATAYVPTTTAPPTTEATEPPVVMAPEFVITDKIGGTFGILNFKGKPSILCFWTTSAEKELDLMQQMYDTYSESANFVMIHVTAQEETVDTALAFLEQKDYTFPVYFDTMGSAASAYKVTDTPTTFFMAADTELKARSKGALDPAKLPEALASIGISPTVEEPETTPVA